MRAAGPTTRTSSPPSDARVPRPAARRSPARRHPPGGRLRAVRRRRGRRVDAAARHAARPARRPARSSAPARARAMRPPQRACARATRRTTTSRPCRRASQRGAIYTEQPPRRAAAARRVPVRRRSAATASSSRARWRCCCAWAASRRASRSGFSPGGSTQPRRVRRPRLRRALVGRGLLPADRLGHVRPDPGRRAAARASRRARGDRRRAATARRDDDRRGDAGDAAAAPPRRPATGAGWLADRRSRALLLVVARGRGVVAARRRAPVRRAALVAPELAELERALRVSGRPRRSRRRRCRRSSGALGATRRRARLPARAVAAQRFGAAARRRPSASAARCAASWRAGLGRVGRLRAWWAMPPRPCARAHAAELRPAAARRRVAAAVPLDGDGDAYELFRNGTELLEPGDLHAAAVPLSRARDLEPTKDSIREALGRALFGAQRYGEAARGVRGGRRARARPTTTRSSASAARCSRWAATPRRAIRSRSPLTCAPSAPTTARYRDRRAPASAGVSRRARSSAASTSSAEQAVDLALVDGAASGSSPWTQIAPAALDAKRTSAQAPVAVQQPRRRRRRRRAAPRPARAAVRRAARGRCGAASRRPARRGPTRLRRRATSALRRLEAGLDDVPVNGAPTAGHGAIFRRTASVCAGPPGESSGSGRSPTFFVSRDTMNAAASSTRSRRRLAEREPRGRGAAGRGRRAARARLHRPSRRRLARALRARHARAARAPRAATRSRSPRRASSAR